MKTYHQFCKPATTLTISLSYHCHTMQYTITITHIDSNQAQDENRAKQAIGKRLVDVVRQIQ